MEWLLVIFIRLIVPLSIFRFPLIGSILAIIADNLDVVILDFLGIKEFAPYNQVDKFLDTYFALIQGYIVYRWNNDLAKKAGIFLLAYRIIGAIIYEITNIRALLFIFPNVFEFYFIYYLAYKRLYNKEPFKTKKTLFITLLFLTLPKLFQEYMLHVRQFPIYAFLKEHVLWMF